MARITVSVEAGIARAAKKRAAQQRRSVSGYVQMLLEDDLCASGILTPSHRVFVSSEIAAAISEATRHGIDPIAALRARIAEVEREQANSNPPTPPA